MSHANRPLSPHLQVYRPQLTSILSISHRITGVALAAGAAMLAVWLLCLAGGRESYATANAVVGSLPGKIVVFGFTFALYYHLCNGIRHLFWDAGLGFELETAYASGKAVVAAAVALTIVTWVVVIASGVGS
jgi:succinate dehydrogenase / fumarate reductase cytochrome b subunit